MCKILLSKMDLHDKFLMQVLVHYLHFLFIFTISKTTYKQKTAPAIPNNIKAGLNLTGYMVEKPEPDGKEGSKYTLLFIYICNMYTI